MRVILKLGRSCNNDCIFCHASARSLGDHSLTHIEQKLDHARDLGADTVILSGGEPTIRSDLMDVADLAKARGLQLGLITNGRRLSDPSLVDALLTRGLSYAYISLHGSNAAVHDAMVGTPAFDETTAGIRLVHGRIPMLTINTVVTRSNLHDLEGVVDLLHPLPHLSLKFTMPQPKGAALGAFDDVVPRLVDAAAAVAKAIRGGLQRAPSFPRDRYGHEGFPLCLLPNLEDLQSNLLSHDIAFMSELEDEGFEPIDDLLLTKPPKCNGCDLRRACPGIYRVYLEKRGDGELRPVLGSGQSSTEERELAAQEERAWVRLTYACNNRCLFCLDRDVGRNQARSVEEVRNDVVAGRKQGATRLVLSGGEPTTHPRFIDFLRLGRRAGYQWIQVISNGRMFSYPKFLGQAISAGLREITVSMHGHTPELHDEMVGAEGAFAQASRAIKMALRSGKVVINIDIVVNAKNVAHLPDMLETFVGWGVREFDLLHIIPFGNAWHAEHRDLFYDPAAHLDTLRRAFAFSEREGVHLWLNRFPPPCAEGFESLIQDPHKLHDEVRGRAEEFETYLRGGPPLRCRQSDRCERCYLRDFCDGLEQSRNLSSSDHVPFLRLRAPLPDHVRLPRADLVEVIAKNAEQAALVLPRLRAQTVRLRLDDVGSLLKWLDESGRFEGVELSALVVSTAREVKEALALPGPFDVVIEINRDTASGLEQLAPHHDRIILAQPRYARVTDALSQDVDLRELFDRLGREVRTEGIAPCLSPSGGSDQREPLDMETLGEDGHIDPQRFTSFYIRDGFFTRSLRCEGCRDASRCRGMHINWVRAHGFGALIPRNG